MLMGKNKVVFTPEGKPVAWVAITKKASPTEPDRFVLSFFDKTVDLSDSRRRVYGIEDLRNTIVSKGWVEKPSFLTVACELAGTKVKVNLTHSCIPFWSSTYEVDYKVGWNDEVLKLHQTNARAAIRESWIANLRDLTV